MPESPRLLRKEKMKIYVSGTLEFSLIHPTIARPNPVQDIDLYRLQKPVAEKKLFQASVPEHLRQQR